MTLLRRYRFYGPNPDTRYSIDIEESCRWKDLEDSLGACRWLTDSLAVARALTVVEWVRWGIWDDRHRRVYLIDLGETGEGRDTLLWCIRAGIHVGEHSPAAWLLTPAGRRFRQWRSRQLDRLPKFLRRSAEVPPTPEPVADTGPCEAF